MISLWCGLLFICSLGIAYSDEIYEVYNLISKYERLLDFFYPRLKQMNIDGVFGLVIASDQLSHILDRKIDSTLRTYLAGVHYRTEYMIDESKQINNFEEDPNMRIISTLLMPTGWKRTKKFVDNQLFIQVPKIWTRNDLAMHMTEGMPQESESDRCIIDVINSGLNFQLHTCSFSEIECPFNMTDTTNTYGYPLTHKLLYWQVADAIGCTDIDVDQTIRKNMCSKILSEAKAIEALYFPHFARDLFLEQTVLCGIEGYTEFLKPSWRQKIQSFQGQHGCASATDESDSQIRKKRDTKMLDYGCDTHMNGLLAASFMLQLNYLLSSPPWWN